MGLFNFKHKEKKPQTQADFVRYELEMKAKSGKSMSADEYAALQRYRTRDVWDQVFRIAGVVTVLAVLMLAVFVFLYPFSIFNVFNTSGNDQFWSLWNHWIVNVGKDYGNGTAFNNEWAGSFAELAQFDEDGNFIGVAATGFVTMATVLAHGFQPGSTWKANFYCIGGWTIYVVATIGFVAIIIGAAFILASNIKNLIGVIRHLGTKTSETFSQLGTTAKESYEEAVPEAKEKKTKTPRKKKEVAPAEEEPVVLDDTEEEVAKRVEELKEELKEEEVKEQPKVVPVTEAPKAETKKASTKFDTLADDDIDRLLGGK